MGKRLKDNPIRNSEGFVRLRKGFEALRKAGDLKGADRAMLMRLREGLSSHDIRGRDALIGRINDALVGRSSNYLLNRLQEEDHDGEGVQ